MCYVFVSEVGLQSIHTSIRSSLTFSPSIPTPISLPGRTSAGQSRSSARCPRNSDMQFLNHGTNRSALLSRVPEQRAGWPCPAPFQKHTPDQGQGLTTNNDTLPRQPALSFGVCSSVCGQKPGSRHEKKRKSLPPTVAEPGNMPIELKAIVTQ